MTSPADDLHRRYMAASTAYRDHRAACGTCTDRAHCETGARLYSAFARLQDTYLARQRQRRR